MRVDLSNLHTRRDLFLMGLSSFVVPPLLAGCDAPPMPVSAASNRREDNRADQIMQERVNSLILQAKYLEEALKGKVVVQPKGRLRLIIDGSIHRREQPEAKGFYKTLDTGMIEIIDNPLVVIGKRTRPTRPEEGEGAVYDSWIAALTGKEPDFYGRGGFEFFAYSPETLTDNRDKKLILALENGSPVTPSIAYVNHFYNFAGRQMVVDQVRQNPDINSSPVVVGRDLNGRIVEATLPVARRIDQGTFNSSIQSEYGINAYVVMEFVKDLPR